VIGGEHEEEVVGRSPHNLRGAGVSSASWNRAYLLDGEYVPTGEQNALVLLEREEGDGVIAADRRHAEGDARLPRDHGRGARTLQCGGGTKSCSMGPACTVNVCSGVHVCKSHRTTEKSAAPDTRWRAS